MKSLYHFKLYEKNSISKNDRENKKSLDWSDKLCDKSNHVKFINMLFLNNKFEGSEKLHKELKKSLVIINNKIKKEKI